jgi:nucleotide-binding universal stress UspA family protein
MKILLAVDGSECSQAAVSVVAERPWPQDTEIKILSAVEPLFVPTSETWVLPDSYYTQLDKAAQEIANYAVTHAAERLQNTEGARLAVTAVTKNGKARDVILAEAERWGADLIVLGSHGYSGWQRLWLGSVSTAVATHAPCSVEIVRQRERK